jgi:hypothetical protein
MRENRPYGSEGGEGNSFPTPIALGGSTPSEYALEEAGACALSETAMVQTSGVMEIKGSPAKLIGLLAMGAVMTALGAALAFGWFPGPSRGNEVAAGWTCLVFSGWCTAVVVWRLLKAGQTVITITPDGNKDIRLAVGLVSWSAVSKVSSAQIGWQRFILLAVDPSMVQQLPLKRAAKWSIVVNRMFGFDGLCVLAIGLRINHDTLLRACLAHWRGVGGPS